MANRQFVLYVMKNKEVDHFRLGISVSKKVGKAVVRNKMRRMIKEIVRHLAPRIVPHHDLVIIVRNAALDLDYEAMSKSIYHVFNKAGMISKRQG